MWVHQILTFKELENSNTHLICCFTQSKITSTDTVTTCFKNKKGFLIALANSI